MAKQVGSKLSKNQIQRVSSYVSLGMSDSVIARSIGVHPSTFKSWLEKGEHIDPAINYEYCELASAYHGSKADLQHGLLQRMDKFAARDFRACSWLLERVFREDFNPSLNDLMQKEMGSVLNKLEKVLPEESFNELSNAFNIIQAIESGEIEESALESSQQTVTVEAITS